ncbi:galectin-4-like isoform X1 [Brachyistius frenatus]|uniref:galectin-4-like isoform X1 n=1 Tax=Brachyistius frenatus TaxID=100188 RepID=UPI0037E96933
MPFVAPPGYQPVYGPKIPYLGPIYGGLRDGVSIYIQGSTPEDITRFFINLHCGESESSDIAMHFNPRFDGWDKVVFNSCQKGDWQSQEKIRSMPFSKGKSFEMVIMVTSQGYQIKVNGKDFHMFPHRLPVERVCAMQIGGDVSVQTINVIGGGMGGGKGQGGHPGGGAGGGYPGGPGGGSGGGYPGGPGGGSGGGYPGGPGGGSGGGYPGGPGGGSGGGYPGGPGGGSGGGYPGGPGGGSGGGYPGGPGGGSGQGGYPGCDMGQGGYPGSNLPGMGGQPVYNPPVPYSTKIPGGMSPKRTIIIRGMVPYAADQISINFMVGRSRDIAFHMNPRVKTRVVVRNSMIGGKWGREEQELSMSPFKEGQYFDVSKSVTQSFDVILVDCDVSSVLTLHVCVSQMSIRCGNQKFKVYVNGQHLLDFVHRLQSFSEIDTLEIMGDVKLSYIHF